jgi:hypothetical protein
MLFYNSHPNIHNLVDVFLEIKSETNIKYRIKGVKVNKMYEIKALIREQMINLELLKKIKKIKNKKKNKINNFDLVKSSSFKFLPKQ